MKKIEVDGVLVPVCQSCLDGEHNSYGCDHRDGPPERRDCKNLSKDRKTQCMCNPEWPELMTAIRMQARS